LGVPQQFSFIATFCSKVVARTEWHILKITDYQNDTHLQITLNQIERAVGFSIVNYDGYLQTVIFEASNVCYFLLYFIIFTIMCCFNVCTQMF